MIIKRIRRTPSTNELIQKYIKKGKDITIIAQSQTRGKGTKDRFFSSEVGGIYLSRLKFYDDFLAANAFSIIEDISIAVIKTLRAFDIKAKIKWPNDILVDNKKICGILTENKIVNDKIVHSIVGVGLNVFNPIPIELKDIAISMAEKNQFIDFETVLSTLLFNLPKKAEVGLYARYSAILGKEITVEQNGELYVDEANEILKDGRLKLKSGKILSAGEVKIKV